MRVVMKIFVAAVVCALVSAVVAGDGEVLWWEIGENYQSISGSAADGSVVTAGDLGVTDARIRYFSDDGSQGYLTMLGINEDGSVSVYDGIAGLGAADGMGIPAEYFGSLSGLSGESYSFVIELGNYIDGSWARTSMESEAVSYTELKGDLHIVAWDGQSPKYGSAWSPSSYSVVPEPSGGLLSVLGFAVLALRRKRIGS